MAKDKIKRGLAQPLYRNEEAIKMMLYQITPVLTNWAHAQKEAQRQSNPKNAGRKPISPVLMFLILMVKEFLGLSNLRLAQILISDKSIKFFIRKQIHWLIKCGKIEQTVKSNLPKISTIRKYLEIFSADGVLSRCKSMATACFIADSVNIAKARRLPPPQRIGLIDASIIPIAVTHLPRGIYQKIKNGHIREVEGVWPYRRLCQLNLDARWTKKNNKRFFGFKLHTLTDAVTKIVLHDIFTPANIHDVNQLLELCNHAPESMVKIYADSGYCSEDREQTMSESGLKSMFIKRPYSHRSLTYDEKIENNKRSSVRCRVEHIFAGLKLNQGFLPKSKSTVCIKGECDLVVLAYNTSRYQVIIDGRLKYPKFLIKEKNRSIGDLVRVSG